MQPPADPLRHQSRNPILGTKNLMQKKAKKRKRSWIPK
jgi:hypothetical protein